MARGWVVKILLAEDQEIVRIGIKLLLESESSIQIVGESANGEQACKLALDLKPDLILMDLGMPVMDGIDATREIKKQLPDIKIVILTTHENDTDVYAAMAAGADGYCIKNANKQQLVMAICSVMEGAIWMDPAIAGCVLKAFSSSIQSKPLQPQATNHQLTNRELDVLTLIVEGLSNQQIAERLVVSVETVKTHMRHIMEKLQVSDRTQVAVKALKISSFHSKLH